MNQKNALEKRVLVIGRAPRIRAPVRHGGAMSVSGKTGN